MLSHILFTGGEMITNNFTPMHQAIDVVSENGGSSDVIAYDDGTIIFVTSDVTENNTNTTGLATYGNYIKIKHENGIQTLYAHLKYGSIKVKNGDFVKKGQIIATMGNTGRAFGVHLHFEVRDYNDKRLNPYDYLWRTVNNPVIMENMVFEEANKQELPNEKIENSDTLEEVLDNRNDDEEENIESKKVLEEIIETNNLNTEFTLFENSEYKYISLSDALSEIYVNNSFEYREKLANKNGIENYTGSELQNLKLLTLLKEGNLKSVY